MKGKGEEESNGVASELSRQSIHSFVWGHGISRPTDPGPLRAVAAPVSCVRLQHAVRLTG